MPTTASARAPGKIILAGEHFVVLGAPAIAMAINLHSRVQVRPMDGTASIIDVNIPLKLLPKSQQTLSPKDSTNLLKPLRMATEATLAYVGRRGAGVSVDVDCEIPIGAGLGSSASTTVAIVSAVSRSQNTRLTKKEIYDLAFIPERFLHGHPSGVDQAACIHGGFIQFKRPSTVKHIRTMSARSLLLCDTGIHHATGTLVRSVVKRSQTERARFRDLLAEARQISNGVVRALRSGDDEDLGRLMSQNHTLLRKIGVSHPKLDRLVAVAEQSGALGAKLTGAGGGGCIVAVCKDIRSRRSIARRLKREGGIPYEISQDTLGVEATVGGRALK